MAGVSTQWFLCLFVNSLPLETCLRVWDILFFERCSSVLFRVAMALVDIYAQAHPTLPLPTLAFTRPLLSDARLEQIDMGSQALTQPKSP